MNYRNARYIDADGTIDCEIEHPTLGWVPYTIRLDDADETVDNDALLNTMKEAQDVAAFVPPTEEEILAAKAASVRQQRDDLLQTNVDPIAGNILRYGSLTDEQKTQLAEYRQALLDVTLQDGFPEVIEWPSYPL